MSDSYASGTMFRKLGIQSGYKEMIEIMHRLLRHYIHPTLGENASFPVHPHSDYRPKRQASGSFSHEDMGFLVLRLQGTHNNLKAWMRSVFKEHRVHYPPFCVALKFGRFYDNTGSMVRQIVDFNAQRPEGQEWGEVTPGYARDIMEEQGFLDNVQRAREFGGVFEHRGQILDHMAFTVWNIFSNRGFAFYVSRIFPSLTTYFMRIVIDDPGLNALYLKHFSPERMLLVPGQLPEGEQDDYYSNAIIGLFQEDWPEDYENNRWLATYVYPQKRYKKMIPQK